MSFRSFCFSTASATRLPMTPNPFTPTFTAGFGILTHLVHGLRTVSFRHNHTLPSSFFQPGRVDPRFPRTHRKTLEFVQRALTAIKSLNHPPQLYPNDWNIGV